MFKKVAVVEKFFDIIYSVHVESREGDTQLRGRAGKHCGQKRTYRAVSVFRREGSDSLVGGWVGGWMVCQKPTEQIWMTDFYRIQKKRLDKKLL